jgi:hypothetical protein
MTLSAATPANRRSDQARRSSPPWRYRRPERTKRAKGPLSPTVLIYGSAIKTSANLPGIINMQFSNRRQTGGQAIESLIIVEKIRPDGALSTKFLIATVEYQNLSHLITNTPVTKILTATRSECPQWPTPSSSNVARVFRPEVSPSNLGFSARRMLLCLRQPNEANIPTKRPRAPK